MMCATDRGMLRQLLSLQELIKYDDEASAPPMLGDAALLLLPARLILAGLVLAVVLVLAGLAGFVLARFVFAGLALATVFVAGGAFLLLLAGALAARA